MISEVDWFQSLAVWVVMKDHGVYWEVNFGRTNSSIFHQLRYINTVSWIGGNVAVHLRKVDNPERKVISVSLEADTERCIYVASLDIRVEITHFSRWCGSVPAKVPIPKGKLRLMCFPKSTLFRILKKSSMYRKVLLNWMAFVMSCFIVLTMKS